MEFDEFHALPTGDQYKDRMLLDLAKTAPPPASLRYAQNKIMYSVKGAGEVTARQILQAVAMCWARKLPLEKHTNS